MGIYILQFVNFTLSFFMWLIIGRIMITLLIGNRQNFMVSFFVRFTEPFYKITRKLFPFAKESYIPPTAILIIVVLRILLIVFKTAIQYK